MFDVGDLPVLTFGNWVLKAEWLNCLWNYMYVFLRLFTFFSKSKKTWLFTFFWVVAHVFPNSGAHRQIYEVVGWSMTVQPAHTAIEYSFQSDCPRLHSVFRASDTIWSKECKESVDGRDPEELAALPLPSRKWGTQESHSPLSAFRVWYFGPLHFSLTPTSPSAGSGL